MGVEVIGRSPQKSGVILELPHAEIAGRAKDTAYLSGPVAVVNIPLGFSGTDADLDHPAHRTPPALFVEHRGKFGYGDSVGGLNQIAPLVPGIHGAKVHGAAQLGAIPRVSTESPDVLPAMEALTNLAGRSFTASLQPPALILTSTTPAPLNKELTRRERIMRKFLFAPGASVSVHAIKSNTRVL